ncbi:hypothetical protein NQ317_015154 [Molorchus minor]|uniref:Rhodanese domain-containing protein n=1 Tax=Molorchus minor TaxID=1323400 RepID=A0ABQ9K7R4_9CUCU|nr:hypothetical protein NQ317_015154 [Molorchus minor]
MAEGKEDRIITYEEIKTFENSKDVLIIDVREPDEIASTGKIGGSVNIPLGELENSLKSLSDGEFQKKYNIPKPKPELPLVFSCRLGGRAEKAMHIALKQGYPNAKYYKGSWNEWQEKNKGK